MLFNFGSMQQVQSRAQRIIDSILSDKSYLNPQKFQSILRDYEKRQSKLDAEVSISIRNQIQNINYAKQNIQEANKSMVQSKERIENINAIYSKQLRFHNSFETINKIYTYQSNISTVLDQLKSFINLEGEIVEIRAMIEDESTYEVLNEKMLNLLDLRENVMKKLDLEKSKDITLIKKEFEEVELLEKEFYNKVFEKFRFCIKLSKNNPTSLVTLAKIIERGDQILESRGKAKFMKQRALENINESIDLKFKEKIGKLDSIVEMIEEAKFVTQDLIDVLDYLAKCFPSRYKMFQIYQNRYQMNIEKYVMPKFEVIAEEKEYGNLLVLLTWIEDYECILERAGVTSDNYIILKSKVKEIMPFFIEHNQALIRQFIENCINLDKQKFNREYYEGLIRTKSEFVSHYPSDIFGFVNKEAEIIKGHVRGELFIEFIRCITTELNAAQFGIREEMEENYRNVEMTKNQDVILEFEYLTILHLNNFSECLKHASEAKEQYTEIVSQAYQDRVRKIFLTEVQKKFNQSIGIFVNMIVGVIYLDFKRTQFIQLFTQKWSEDNKRELVSIIINSVTQESKDIESLINNPVNYRLLVKTNYDYYCILYVEVLIYQIKNYYGLNFKWQPQHLNLQYMDRQYKKTAFKLTKSILAEGIQKDNIIILGSAEAMSQYLNKDFVNKLENKLNLLKQCFTKNKLEFQKLLEPLHEMYQETAKPLLQITLCVREELDKSLLSKFEDVSSKKIKK